MSKEQADPKSGHPKRRSSEKGSSLSSEKETSGLFTSGSVEGTSAQKEKRKVFGMGNFTRLGMALSY